MKNKPLVSVIIPIYNRWEFVPECFDSLQEQTFKDFEVIIVLDGSEEDRVTEHMYKCKVFPTFVWRVLKITNRGCGSARNAGVLNSEAEFFLPLDEDDKLRPDALEKYIAKQKETNADVVYCDLQCFGVNTEMYPMMKEVTLEGLLYNNGIPICSLIRRSAFNETGGYNGRMIYGWEDWDLWIDLCERGKKFAHIAEGIFLYRKRKGTMSQDAFENHYSWNNMQIRKNHPKLNWP